MAALGTQLNGATIGGTPTGTATATQGLTPASSSTSSSMFNADGSLNLGGLVSSTLTGAAGVYGSQNGAQQVQQADMAAIGTQQNTNSAVQGIYGTQATTGNNAMSTLAQVLGTGGSAPDPSVFMNQPGYQFAIQQGTQAINRQAAANGNLYTPNTLTSVGQYVTNTADQNYNNYVQQLLSAAGLGSTANQGLASAQLQTGANISQLQQNTGIAGASGVAGASGAVGSTLGALLGGSSGTSGLSAALSSLFGGSSSASTGIANTVSDVNSALSTPGIDLSSLNSGVTYNNSGVGASDSSILNPYASSNYNFGSSTTGTDFSGDTSGF